jgi:CheY-like chemotaxis protein
MPSPVVVVAATNLLPSLRDRLADEGDLLTFADTEPIQALQAILEKKPDLIVLERLFAATPRGAALINRIKTDPHLANAEVRVMSHTGDYVRQVAKPSAVEAVTSAGSHASGVTVESRQLDWHGTRRAPRVKIRSGVEIQLDGNFVMRFRGAIAWAKFELPQPASPPRYRAGVEFIDADAAAVDAFGSRNKA